MQKCHGCRNEGDVPQHVEVSFGEHRVVYWCEECAQRIIDQYMKDRW